ncbi:glycosyltransferase family 39 protein, partial [uncultured Chloroflexus sp.]|uniref:ArnT family glycosyltransferase n=1 Tax=uncultured Chloroflexus sp. TaxID=214040 RepID=UPI00262D2803
MIRVLNRLTKQSFPALLLPIALTALACGVLLLDLPRPVQRWQVWDINGPALAGFHALEQNDTDLFRWSQPQASIFIDGYRGAPALVELRLSAPRPPDTAPARVTLFDYHSEITRMTVAGDWRRYRLLVPTTTTGEPVLRWSTDPYSVFSDARELGVVLSEVRLATLTGAPPLSAQTLRWGLLPLVVWLAGTAWRWPARWRNALAILSIAPALWLALMPVSAEYWLPTLPWPWWPLLPVLVLTGWRPLTTLLRRVYCRLTAKPVISWGGLIGAFCLLLAMRVGLPWGIGLPLVLIGVWLAMPVIGHRDEPQSMAWPTGWLLVGITALALGARLVALDQLPVALWRDEARHGLLAFQIWTNSDFRPIYVVKDADLPALLFYLMAPVVGILGPQMWSARLVSALAGALTPLALYWFAAPLIGRRAAIFGAALLAWSSWSLSMSRWAFPATLDHLFVLTAAGFLWRGLDPAWKGIRPWLYVAIAAALGGLAIYTYHTGRIAPLALLLVALLRIGRSWSRWRMMWPRLLMAALIGGLVVAPLVWYVFTDIEGFNRRLGIVSIFQSSDLTRRRPLDFLLEHTIRYALMWHGPGEENGRHHLPLAPMVDPITGLWLLVGLGLVWRERHQAVIIFGILWLIYVLPGLFSFNPPHAMRALGTLAPACALAGWGISCVRLPFPSWRQWLVPAALLFSLGFNLWLYFGLMRVDPRVYGEFDRVETVMAQLVRLPATSTHPAWQRVEVYLLKESAVSDTVRFLTADLPQPPRVLTSATQPGPDVVVILPANADPDLVAFARAMLGSTAIEIT